ncbi:hypothetical protein QQS45_04550 [Alteriqipengyuania flavescens]|uniref:hypothetical protein n=1 Tax=Alteriqipengyuania flavescens TaxID=3053610 RepID=UPI0025B2CA45|nr:hypothetical protein [Alteriqipengyuania flavescens]WJY19500.1 hypothetical protein QQW98_04545 [Alteriqipengyuania flavescens]WJY25442.1 hypothetical protein QQS45_04550 [Alteriqipengyuania flavescens]
MKDEASGRDIKTLGDLAVHAIDVRSQFVSQPMFRASSQEPLDQCHDGRLKPQAIRALRN